MEFSLIKGHNLLIKASSIVHSGDKGLTKMSDKMRYTIEPMTCGGVSDGGEASAAAAGGGPSAGAINLCKILENSLIENRGETKTLIDQKLVYGQFYVIS